LFDVNEMKSSSQRKKADLFASDDQSLYIDQSDEPSVADLIVADNLPSDEELEEFADSFEQHRTSKNEPEQHSTSSSKGISNP
jgi:hypothetical protein